MDQDTVPGQARGYARQAGAAAASDVADELTEVADLRDRGPQKAKILAAS